MDSGLGLLGLLSPILSIFGSFMSVFGYLLLLIAFAYVLYYFTGNEKKADGFMPSLMSQALRTYHYVWLFLSSLALFWGFMQMLYYIFSKIFPEAGGRDADVDSMVFIKGFILLLFVGLFAGAHVFINRKAVEISGIGGTVSTKTFIAAGLILFSVVTFASGWMAIMNVVNYVDETSNGLSSYTFAVFFSALVLWSAYLGKAWMVLQKESGK